MKKRHPPQLYQYRWKGTNRIGRPASGQSLALSETEVRDKLKAQQIRVHRIRKHPPSLVTRARHRAKRKDITILTRQLATMLMTGVPLTQALRMVANSHRKAEMSSILTNLVKGIESGCPLSQTMQTTSRLFDSLYVELVTSGELSGHLPQVFERIATYREKSEQLSAKVLKALIYPCLVLSTAISVTYLMLTAVIPEFEAMFNSFGADLPWFTQQILALSHRVQHYGAFLVVMSIAAVFTIKMASARSFRIRLAISRASLKLPIAGQILAKAAIAKYCRTLATTFDAGIPILSSLNTAAKTTNSVYYQHAIEQICHDTAAGMPMYIAMRNSDAFPDMVLQMVMIGEESGQLDDMLKKVATIYEYEIAHTVDSLGKVLEPVIILFLGVVVGGLVVAMYLPIFNLMSVLG